MTRFVHLIVVGVLLAGTLTLTACGFALRGTSSSLHTKNTQVHIMLDDSANASALKHTLSQHLQLLGIQPDSSATQQIVVSNVHLRRYELIGTLTEVRLVLGADVRYVSPQQTSQTIPVQVEHSYQYNEASIVALDQQGSQATTWLYDALAQRIAEQYRAMLVQSD